MKKKSKIFIYIGLLLIVAASLLAVYNIYASFRAGKISQQAVEWLKEESSDDGFLNPEDEMYSSGEKSFPDYILNPDMEMPVENRDGIDYIGVLSIPTLELELPVISEWSDTNLKNAPCRYSGSAYKDNLVIAGHNYRSHFGTLKKLNVGDVAIFTDVEGNQFIYEMSVREVLSPTDVEEMTQEEWALTLFTCTVGGKNRITIRFERLNHY